MSGGWSLDAGGQSIWRVDRSDTSRVAVSMANVNPGTFSAGLVVVLYAKVAISASTVVTPLTIQYNPLIPVHYKYAHMVFGGFSATHVQTKPLGSVRFFHMGEAAFGTQTDVIDDAMSVETAQIAQKIMGPNTYIQWISPFFKRMEMRVETAGAIAAGEHVCTILLGDFGQPNFVQARRFGTIRASVGGTDVVVGYRVAKQLAAVGDSMALAPSYDMRSMHVSGSEASGWTQDDAYCSLAIHSTPLLTYDFWGVFYYNMWDATDMNIELFKLLVADVSETGTGRNVALYLTILLSANGSPPLRMDSYAPTDPIQGSDWKATMKSDALYQSKATVNVGDFVAAQTNNSFAIMPWRDGTNRMTHAATDITVASPNMHNFTPAHNAFDTGIIGSRNGDMFGMLMTRSAASTTVETLAKIQVFPYAFNQVGKTLSLRAKPESAAASSVVNAMIAAGYAGVANSFKLGVELLPSAAEYNRMCEMPRKQQAIRLGRISGAWGKTPSALVSVAPGADLASSAARFMIGAGPDVAADGKTINCSAAGAPVSFSRALRACAVSYGPQPPASLGGFKHVTAAGAQAAFPSQALTDFFRVGRNALSSDPISRCPASASSDASCPCPSGQLRNPATLACGACDASTHHAFGGMCVPNCAAGTARITTDTCIACDTSTHEIVGDACLPKCKKGQSRGADQVCACPDDMELEGDACEKRGLPGWAIVAIVVGVLAVVGAVIGAAIFFRTPAKTGGAT
jgi:hypothetical protein